MQSGKTFKIKKTTMIKEKFDQAASDYKYHNKKAFDASVDLVKAKAEFIAELEKRNAESPFLKDGEHLYSIGMDTYRIHFRDNRILKIEKVDIPYVKW